MTGCRASRPHQSAQGWHRRRRDLRRGRGQQRRRPDQQAGVRAAQRL